MCVYVRVSGGRGGEEEISAYFYVQIHVTVLRVDIQVKIVQMVPKTSLEEEKDSKKQKGRFIPTKSVLMTPRGDS